MTSGTDALGTEAPVGGETRQGLDPKDDGPATRSGATPEQHPSQGSATPVPLAEALEKLAEEALREADRYQKEGRLDLREWWHAQHLAYSDAARMALEAEASIPTPHPAPVARPAGETETFQARVQPWLLACFGEEIARDREERNHRFLEEALELVQAKGCTAHEAHQLVDYVYGRPVGIDVQEVGGVMVTLAALCLASHIDMHQCGEWELARIWTKVEKIRAKQAAKPKHSPLPEVLSRVPASPSGSGAAILAEARSGLVAFTGGVDGACSETIRRIDEALASAPTADTSGRGSGTGGGA